MPLPRTNSSTSIDTSAATMGGTNNAATVSNSNIEKSQSLASELSNTNKSDYVNYLMSYEGMVRHQDLEFNATSGHIKCIFERIQTLGSKKAADGDIDTTGESSLPRGMLTYLQLRRCLIRMGVGWKRSSSDSADYDDDVSVLSFNSTSSLHSGMSGGSTSRSDIIATDAQLIMLLTTLVEMEEKYRCDVGQSKTNNKYQLDQGLFLPEFIQAYKLIIGGMQSLKSIPNPDDPVLSGLCNRLKERTLGMLRPFGPNSKIYNDASRKTAQDDDALSSNKHSLRSNVKEKFMDKKSFSNGYMKKVIRSKDLTLTRIMEDHELEIDQLASSMEELRLEEERTRNVMRHRRKILRWVAFLLLAGGIAGGITWENRRREFLANEIALGREAERVADAKTIAQLKEEEMELKNRLGVIEGKMRYQINRVKTLETQTQGMEKRIDDVDMKWLIDKAEIERCFASQVELSEDLKDEKLKREEVDEESIWCRSRLRSQETKLNELEYIRVGSNEKGLTAKSNGGDNDASGHKLVYLEMKYNKSIRNAMFLRQTYSAVAGLAVSVLLQGLVPTAIKLLFGPKAVIVLPPVLPKRNVEMAVVDGIFGSSVAFLLVRGIATFFMPL
ncbi:hypothetical protein ACHAXR_003295 [Thalassiosira sp. AJA248-18]